MTKELKDFSRENQYLKNKIQDFEDRSRCFHLKLMRIPVRVEKNDPVSCIQDWILKHIVAENFFLCLV